MDQNDFVKRSDDFNQEEVIRYLEDPHTNPFIMRNLLYSESSSKSVGDTHLEYDRTFREIKSQLYDLEDLGVVEVSNPEQDRIERKLGRPKMNVETKYTLTDEAHHFFYGKPYTLGWAYVLAQNIGQEEEIQEEVI